jgi:hypothetical protein
MERKRWIYSGFGVIGAIVVFWIAATLFLSPAYADALPFSMKVRSSLLADYNPDDRKSLFTALRLSILGDSLLDQGLSPEEAEKQRLALEASLDNPVPTATALDFDGNAPPTATPTETPIATETPVPSVTPTKTTVPTKILTKTKTSTPKSVNTASPSDNESPVVAGPGTITPTPGPLGTCSRKIFVSDVQITDAAPSSGINWVKLKYKVYDYAETNIYAGYIYSSPFSLCSGGPTAGGGWDACYDGPPAGFNISIYPGFSSLPDYTGSDPFKVKLWLITEDNAGKSGSHFYGYYEMPNTCDDPPPPTDTPVPTDTTPPSILSLSMSPPSGSILTSCDLMVSDMQLLDPSFSNGISASGVEIKHTRISGGDYYQPAPGVTGGFVSGPGSDWSGSASGMITLSGLGNDEEFDLYGVLDDIAGNGPVYFGPLSYTAPSVGCP